MSDRAWSWIGFSVTLYAVVTYWFRDEQPFFVFLLLVVLLLRCAGDLLGDKHDARPE